MFGCKEMASLGPHASGRVLRILRVAKVSLDSEVGGVAILPMGEEEVKVAKSEAPVLTGVWCKRETFRP